MIRSSVAVIAVALLHGGAAFASPAVGCAALPAAVAKLGACVDTPGGVVIAQTAERAALLAGFARAGEGRFAERFGRAPTRYAVIESAQGTIAKPIEDALKQAGYRSRLPWLSPRGMADARIASIRRAIEMKANLGEITPEAAKRTIDEVIAKEALRPASASRESGALPHELGHLWFIAAWWPGGERTTPDQYGGPAPDWMDETAAVLAEDDALAEQRRSGFAARLNGAAAARAEVLDLTRFMTITHPAAKAVRRTMPKGQAAGVTVMAVSGGDAQAIASAGLVFYLQSRLLADYLIERAGPSAAFVSAGDAFARGETTEQWLAKAGPSLGVPATLPALQADWQAWAAKRYPAA